VITARKIVDLLNEALALDPVSMHALVEHRVPCLPAVEGHPTIVPYADGGTLKLGMLGILNGIAGLDEQASIFGPPIVAVYADKDDRLTGFKVRGDY
jgi:hypothetical protein